MATSLWNRVKSWFRDRQICLDWMQVEVTSLCNAACSYCPRTVYRDRWINRSLSLDAFKKLEPLFDRSNLIYLQGWGEPFLCPHLFDMIRIAKKYTKVGMTTNGSLLDDSAVKEVIKEGVDLIAISLAGTDERNDHIRKGTSIHKVLDLVDCFNKRKTEIGSMLPLVNIAYMYMGSDISELYSLIDLMKGRGVNQIVVSTLDFAASAEMQGYLEPFFNENNKESMERLNDLESYATTKGIQLYNRLVKDKKPQSVCTENVERSLYVSSDGTVSPCVFMNLPVKEGVTYYLSGNSKSYEPLIFGSLDSLSIEEIWGLDSYVVFREGFKKGIYANNCSDCPKLYRH